MQHEQKLHDAIYADFKKSPFENYASELSLVYHDIDDAIKNLRRWARKRSVNTNLVNFPAKSYIIPEPLGTCLVIGAWNYPYQLSLAPAVAALAAGNTVILKPSELPKNTSSTMASLINENFDPGLFKVIEGGIPETTELLNQKFDKIFFTGSVPVGKIVYQAAAKNLTPVTLELGGKSPAIVDKNCNLKTTVKRLVWAKFLNAGQTCIAPDYVLVHQDIQEKFIAAVKAAIEKQQYSVDNHNYVQIINEKNFKRLVSMIDESKVAHGGTYNLAERHIEPTVMQNISVNDTVMEDEIFGPILPILSYANEDEAIAIIKSYAKPLACYVFTNNDTLQKKVLDKVSFGGGGINDAVMHITNSELPFGGVGNSGIGSYHGETGFRTFSHFKSVLDKPGWLEPNLKYYPLTNAKLKLIKFITR